jgi:1-deoxy-D-xylulose-5-phosphate reductoisomerase
MKNLSILGSTGSIGRSTLQVVESFPDVFSIQALAAGTNTALLAEQVGRFRPEVAVVRDARAAADLKQRLPAGTGTLVLHGTDGYRAAATLESADMVVSAVVGAAGLLPTLAAIEAGKDIALANKETLVMAGDIVMKRAARCGVRILPVDSEHSAIFQCLCGHRGEDLDRILLTASGGPFIDRPRETFDTITPEAALKHPNWRMGPKITIDSATLMNKGLEVIEARWLFNARPDQIDVLVHPQSIVHSMVAYRDGSVLAQLGTPDMRTPIAYSLAWPRRIEAGVERLNLAQMNDLSFEEPDLARFPCLEIAFQAMRAGASAPVTLNASNEVAVDAFLNGKIGFKQIPALVSDVMERISVTAVKNLDDVLGIDRQARQAAQQWVTKFHG